MVQDYPLDDHLGERTLLVAAAYLVVRREDDAVLLQLRAGTGYLDGHWALVAGHIDPGESVLEGVLREAAEEAGITVDPADIVPLTTIHRFQRGGPQVEQRADFFFATRRWAGVPTRREPAKAAAMEWFPLTTLPEPIPPHERLVLDALAVGGQLPAVISLPR